MATDISATDTPPIGIFGGTFDPIHNGHLASVDLVSEYLNLSRVHWVLSARPPHKGHVTASIGHRYHMLELALAAHNEQRDHKNDGAVGVTQYVADDTEIMRAETSYTVNTVETFAKRFPRTKLCLIIGSDSLQTLSSWHRYESLLDQVHWIVMNRPGYAFAAPPELAGRLVTTSSQLLAKTGQILLFEDSNIAISSTQLRIQLAESQSDSAKLVKQFLPSVVINYIHAKQLYKIGI